MVIEKGEIMELRVLRYFLAVAKEESITAAAEALHVTQPTLSKQIMALESELGKPLLIRGHRKITLTEDGMFLRKRAQEIVDLADKTEAEFYTDSHAVSGDIFIGSGETRAVHNVAEILKKIISRNPNIRFHLYSGNGEDVSDRLDKGLLDFALFVGIVNMQKYDYMKLPEYDIWGLAMRKDDPMAHLHHIGPDDLAGIPLICSRQALIHNELSGWLGRSFDSLNIAGTYNLIYNAALMAEEGLGYVICIDKLINTAGDGTLCFIPFEPEIKADLFIAWKKSQVFSSAAKKFLEELQRIS